MTLVEEITTAALGRSRKNQPGIIATDAELLAHFNRVYPVFWTIGARVNPSFFGTDVLLDPDSESVQEGWLRPAEAELVYRLEFDAPPVAGEDPEIIIVPLNERGADPFRAAVYEWGQVYRPAGNALDPDLFDEIVCYFSKKPDEAALLTDALEALWPTNFDELLVLEIALLLSAKDEREVEFGRLRADRDAWLRRFIAHLEHATMPLTRSTGTTQRFTAPTVVPLNALLLGGTEVGL